ncbi:MAG: WG repeat-containing protein [Firmicutes bacterium]|nr:WG repeat-containing protein [Bacillota bacterium]
MKKLLSIILAAVMLLGLSSCTIKLSTTSTPAGVPQQTAPVIETSGPIEEDIVRELTLEDRIEEKTTIELVRADTGSDSYIAPAQDSSTHLWGYIDLKGNWVIKPVYRSASEFFGGIACVSDVYNEYIFINRAGIGMIETFDGHSITASSVFGDGIASVRSDVEYVQKMTYIDGNSEVCINLGRLPLAKGVSYKTSRFVELATPFRNGYALVMRTTNATLAAQGISALESAYVIDRDGSVVAAVPQGLDVSEYGFDENMRVVVKADNGLYGLADVNGTVVLSPSYLRVLYCEDGLYLVCNQNGFWGYLDKDGNVVIDFKYNNALPFSEGLAAVSNGTAWGFIDKTGVLVIPYQYDKVQPLKSDPYRGAENNGAFCSSIAVVKAGRYWGAINQNGDILFAAESEECPILSVANGYISFEYNGGCGVFTTDGKLVLMPEYERIGEFR